METQIRVVSIMTGEGRDGQWFCLMDIGIKYLRKMKAL